MATFRDVEIDKIIPWFAGQMKRELSHFDFKGVSITIPPQELLLLLQKEIYALFQILNCRPGMPGVSKDIIDKCAQIANFAMLMADNKQRKK